MRISKSDYMLFLKHPAWLWLKKNDKDRLPKTSANLQAIFDAGHNFEQYAEALFPSGLTLGFKDYDEYLSLPQRTEIALNEGEPTLFQARFDHAGFTCITDVVQVVGHKTVDLYEIKSSTRVKPEHLYDLAFQTVVLENCGYTVQNISVIHANSQFVKSGEIKPEQITETHNVTNDVLSKREFTLEYMRKAYDTATSKTMPDLSPRHAKLGANGEWLSIYQSIVGFEQDSIYKLVSAGADKLGQLEDLGINKLAEIPDHFPLTEKQRRQIEAVRAGRPIIDGDEIKKFIDRLQYPLYFLDYETLSSVVPYFDGHKSCQQIPFQYSVHLIEQPGAEVVHREYLHRDNSDPARSLTERLLSDISDKGTVLVWYESFEKGRNEDLAGLLPEYRQALNALNVRIVDLMLPFSYGWYNDGRFNGSASIKKVLPVLVPELSYKELGIQEGNAAQRLWMEAVLDGKRDKQRERILSDLVEYCKLDTFAMVKIYEVLNSLG